MRVNGAELDRIVEDTDGFSFAYLKELFLSAMIRWMKTRKEGEMPAILRGAARAHGTGAHEDSLRSTGPSSGGLCIAPSRDTRAALGASARGVRERSEPTIDALRERRDETPRGFRILTRRDVD